MLSIQSFQSLQMAFGYTERYPQESQMYIQQIAFILGTND
jgi:hypothetical protein